MISNKALRAFEGLSRPDVSSTIELVLKRSNARAERTGHHQNAWIKAASGGRPFSRDLPRFNASHGWSRRLDSGLLSARARRALALASPRRGGNLALVCRRPAAA